MATRKLLDSLIGKEVCVNLIDKDEFVGILHKTGNETDPNLYLMKNYYYVADDTGNVIGCLFRASYVKKITKLDIDIIDSALVDRKAEPPEPHKSTPDKCFKCNHGHLQHDEDRDNNWFECELLQRDVPPNGKPEDCPLNR